MQRFAALILTIVVLASQSACDAGGDGPPLAERVDSAGVEVVTNRGPDRLLDYTWAPRLTLGGKDEGPEAFFRVGRGRVGVDRSGNIHVLDFDAKRVVIFDSTGQYLRALGRAGQGPGELEFPGTIHVTPDGHVAVRDFAKDGVVRFAPDGSVLPAVRLKAQSPAQKVAFVDSGVIYHWTDFRLEAKSQQTYLHRERGDSLEELAMQEGVEPKMAKFANCGIMMRLPPLLTPELYWDARGDRVAVITGAEYEVTVHDGARRMLVRRDIAPQTSTLEIAQREVGDSMRVSGGPHRCSIPPAEVAEVRGFAPVVPAVRIVALAPDGSLWVQRSGPREEQPVIDLFDPRGNYVGTLPPGTPSPITFMPNGDLVAAQKDKESDVDRLVVYRRNRGGKS